jgi:Tfp pilus assembly protein PilP
MRSVIILVSGILLTAAATCSHAQGQPSGTPSRTPAPAAAARVAAVPPAKPAAKRASKKHVAAKPATETNATATPEGQQGKPGRRDPFESLVGRQKAQADAAKNLPPGKGGLQVSTLRVDGIVHAPNGMIAVVSNPQQRTYFLREGDQLYDGRVDKIAMDGISFHESGKDAFGKPVERQVNKRIYSSAGEEQ